MDHVPFYSLRRGWLSRCGEGSAIVNLRHLLPFILVLQPPYKSLQSLDFSFLPSPFRPLTFPTHVSVLSLGRELGSRL